MQKSGSRSILSSRQMLDSRDQPLSTTMYHHHTADNTNKGAATSSVEPSLSMAHGRDGGKEEKMAAREGRANVLYSAGSMVLLMIQGTMMSVVLRLSRVQTGPSYLPSVSVLLGEAIKLGICFVIRIVRGPDRTAKFTSLGEPVEGGGGKNSRSVGIRLLGFLKDAMPMALPASMFVLQQILLIWSATYLDAVTYQIFNQAFKLVPTAVFARVLLGQKLRPMQWLSVPVLAFGVIMITINTNGSSKNAVAKDMTRSMDWYMAMCACSLAGLSSAFAGVYFERYVKGKLAAGLITRNMQLSIFGVPFSGVYAYLKDGEIIRKDGWLVGFTSSAWAVVWLQVFGGFIIAAVVKYCDNILKNFALAGSVILTVLISIPLFGQWPSSPFLGGVTLVLLSVFMYSGSITMASFTQGLNRMGNEVKQRKMMRVVLLVCFVVVLGFAWNWRHVSLERIVTEAMKPPPVPKSKYTVGKQSATVHI